MIRMITYRLIPLLSIVCGALLLPTIVSAHPFNYGAITTNLIADHDTFHTTIIVPLGPGSRGVQAAQDFFRSYVPANLTISNHDKPCAFTLESVEEIDANKTEITGEYVCSDPIENISSVAIDTHLFADYFQNFDDFFTVSIGSAQWDIVFNSQITLYPQEAQAVQQSFIFRLLGVIGQFIWMGMLHIFTGYDHILFLISIVLLARSVRSTLILVTAFTLAHSITLLLAGFHIVSISSRLVEPAIALTIAYVAFRNYQALRKRASTAKDMFSERWAMTFGFGLVHGLGFASALSETAIPSGFLVPSLLSFNVGIECGQLAILVFVLPAIWLIDRKAYATQILKMITLSIMVLALMWFSIRVTLGARCTTLVPEGPLQLLCI